jgi:carbamate kinase
LTSVVALGGNALMRPGERGTAAEQRANLRTAAAALRPLLDDERLVLTHGNGPQVGNELLRHERAADEGAAAAALPRRGADAG